MINHEYFNSVSLAVLFSMLSACGGGSDEAPAAGSDQACSFSGKIAGGLNYTMSYSVADGCGGAATPDSELITSYAGLGSKPNIKIYHENFQPGLAANNRSGHVVIRMNNTREWQTSPGACSVNITSSQHDITSGKVKISGSGTCSGVAIPDTNTGASGNISISPFTFESIWLTWK